MEGAVSSAQKWRKPRQNYKKCAKQSMADVVGKVINYEPWSDKENAEIDFVLVYKPVSKKEKSYTCYVIKILLDFFRLIRWMIAGKIHLEPVDHDPRRIDTEDYEESKRELKQGEKRDKAAVMRIEYIKLLRENGLEIEIENFRSKFEEYRAIKICETNLAMDFWAEKFLLMKPVAPPLGSVLLIPELENSLDKMIAMYNESLYELPPPQHADIEPGSRPLFHPARYVTPTLKSVTNFIHKFKPERNDTGEDFDSKVKAQLENVKMEAKYEKSNAFIQLISQNEWHSKRWSTKIENFLFKALYGHDHRLKLTKGNPLTRSTSC